MESETAVKALTALAQGTRLAVFRQLVQAGTTGLTVGQIAGDLGVPDSTLSFHLKALVDASLVVTRQQGRFVFCFANYEAMDRLVGFLVDNCCGGEHCEATPRRRCAPGRTTT